ncbi:MAG: FISUMP domain-containing protein [Bacteroidales bacterium]
MDNALTTDLLPMDQPYNHLPWDYPGDESFQIPPNNAITDWVLIELRETEGDPSTAGIDSRISMIAGYVLNDGSVISQDGTSNLYFNLSINENLYVVIHHRNHLSIMSANPLIKSNGVYTYDFTTSADQAYGENSQKELASGVWGMYAADGNADGIVDELDKSEVWLLDAGKSGYLPGDYNLDGETNNPDKNDIWEPNVGKITQIPDTVTSFTCGSLFIDIRDGQSYSTVQIGDQCWMAENLNVGTIIQGNLNMADNGTIEKYCYENIQDSCDIYGGLYQWNELMQYEINEGVKGICPDGWHVPTDDEWCTLENEVDVGSFTCFQGWHGLDAGINLKSTTRWYGGNNGLDLFGFTALPGGFYLNSDFSFNFQSWYAFFWTSTEVGSTKAWNRSMDYNHDNIAKGDYFKTNGLAVRCLKDEEVSNQPPDQPSDPNPQDGAANISVDATINWFCTDPDNDPITYSVYFGQDINPPLVLSYHTDTFYVAGTLQYETTYYWKITTYDFYGDSTVGNVWSFTTASQPVWECGDPLIDSRDGQVYNTAQIGTQCWMAENLNIGTRIDGGYNQTNNWNIEKYCYIDTESNCDVYGGLYQWNEAMQYSTSPGAQGACMSGWHIPTDDEWCILENYVDNNMVVCDIIGERGINVGGRLKETGTSHWNPPNTGATNSYGYTLLGGGMHDATQFTGLGWDSRLWSSTVYLTNYVLYRYFSYNKSNEMVYSAQKYFGMSVRCMKNEE